MVVRKKKELANGLEDLASLNQSTIEFRNIGSNYAIGVDKNKQQLFFYKMMEEGVVKNVFNLENFSHCELKKEGVESYIGELKLVLSRNSREMEMYI